MDEQNDVLAMLEGVVPDQPAAEPKIKVGEKEYSASQIAELEQWKNSYTQTRQAETSEMKELRAEMQTLKELSSQPRSSREETAALVGDILQGIESRGKSKLPVGDEEYLTGKNVGQLAEFIKSQIPTGTSDAKVKALEGQVAQMAEMMVKQNVERDVDKAISKYPDAEREEVLGIAFARLVNKQPLDIGQIAQASHNKHTLDNLDISKLPKAKKEAILKEFVEEEKRKRAANVSPGTGGRPPEAIDEEFSTALQQFGKKKMTLDQMLDMADKKSNRRITRE